jgi:hypothetical protein
MTTFTTNTFGVPLDVEYSIERGYPATREEPGMPDCIDTLCVQIADHDITELLASSILSAIEEECYDHAIRNSQDCDLPDRLEDY